MGSNSKYRAAWRSMLPRSERLLQVANVACRQTAGEGVSGSGDGGAGGLSLACAGDNTCAPVSPCRPARACVPDTNPTLPP